MKYNINWMTLSRHKVIHKIFDIVSSTGKLATFRLVASELGLSNSAIYFTVVFLREHGMILPGKGRTPGIKITEKGRAYVLGTQGGYHGS